MKLKTLLYALPPALLLAAPALPAEETGEAEALAAKLQLVEKDRNGAIYAQPEVDWSAYDKIMLEDATVAFRKNWQRDQNRGRRALSDRVSTSDMERIKSELAALFDEVFAQEMAAGGRWQVVDSAGPDVLRIKPEIVDLDVYAPDIQSSSYTRSYTDSSGSMTLKLGLFDAETGDLLAATSDRRQSPYRGYMQWTTSVSNKGDARRIVQQWARDLDARLAAATGRESAD